METKNPEQIATECGLPTVNLRGTQDWSPPLHPELVVSQLHWSDDTPISAFRIRNKKTGEIISKLADGASGDVDGVYASVLGIEQHKEGKVKPAIYAAIPDLDPDSAAVRLSVGGKEMLADLVGGTIQNIREVPSMPAITLANDGSLKVDTSGMSAKHQADIASAINSVPKMVSGITAGQALKIEA